MKKLLLVFIVSMLCLNVSAQYAEPEEYFWPGERTDIDRDFLKKRFSNNTGKSLEIGWLIPSWNLLDYFYMGSAPVSHYANVTNPDSVIVYESGGNLTYNWLTSVGGVLDPYSPMFDSLQSMQPVPNNSGYTVDSLMILGWYTKVNAGPDTLVAEFIVGTPLTEPEFKHVIFSYTLDTFHVSPPSVYGDSIQMGHLCHMTAPTKVVVKYVLTDTDSTNSLGKYIIFPVGIHVPAGKIIGLSLTFVPGQPYTFGSQSYSYSHTMTQVVNSFRAGLYSTDDPTANPHIFAEPYLRYSSTQLIRKQIRYHTYTGSNSWRNDRMSSSVDWGFDIGYYITSDSATGISETTASDISVYPNPATEKIYVTNPGNGNVELSIVNASGAVIRQTSFNTPNHCIDLQGFETGIYFARLVSGKNVIVKKIVVY